MCFQNTINDHRHLEICNDALVRQVGRVSIQLMSMALVSPLTLTRSDVPRSLPTGIAFVGYYRDCKNLHYFPECQTSQPG